MLMAVNPFHGPVGAYRWARGCRSKIFEPCTASACTLKLSSPEARTEYDEADDPIVHAL
jgi:hypothetical protein